MIREERNTKLKAFITCLKCEVSGKPCDDNCPTQYEAGNMGEIIENLETISKALEQEPTTKNNTVDFNKINELADFAIEATGQRDSYSQGMCNGIEYLRATLTDTEPKYFDLND